MNPVLKEYKGVIAAVSVALLGAGGSGAFCWFAFEARESAIQLLKSKSDEINRFRNATPPPSKLHSDQLLAQFKEVEKTVGALRQAIVSNDAFSPQPISPQDFQKALNEKAQALFKKADKDSVALPVGEGETTADSFFYLSFKEFKTKPPSPEKAPNLNRQLLLTELLLNLLLDNHPLAIKKVKLLEPETPPVIVSPPVPAKTTTGKKDAKPEPPPAPAPAPKLNAQGFEIHFSARPENLREFLNALTTQKQAFFVSRNLKVVNSKEKEAPKKGESSPTPGAFSLNAAPATAADNSAKYVLGDEFVDVELTLESLTVPPLAENAPKDAPKR